MISRPCQTHPRPLGEPEHSSWPCRCSDPLPKCSLPTHDICMILNAGHLMGSSHQCCICLWRRIPSHQRGSQECLGGLVIAHAYDLEHSVREMQVGVRNPASLPQCWSRDCGVGVCEHLKPGRKPMALQSSQGFSPHLWAGLRWPLATSGRLTAPSVSILDKAKSPDLLVQSTCFCVQEKGNGPGHAPMGEL